ncbi:MAG: hypothetical protein ACE5HL_05395 [Terriglobia bacterium]
MVNKVSRGLAAFLFFAGCPSLWGQSPERVAPHLASEGAVGAASIRRIEEPRVPELHPFWDKKNLGLHGVNLLAQGLDYWSTRTLIERGYREMNPIVRPFAKSDAAMAAYSFGLGFGGTLATSYLLHRAGRHRWERLVPTFVVGTTATAVALNFRF